MTGASASSRREGARRGLWRIGGGDRSRGETGHLGASLKFSTIVDGDFCGIDTSPLELAGAGRLGVVAAERVFVAGADVGPLDLVDRAGLRSCWLFLRDLLPGVLEVVDLRGRVGDGSRDGRGDGAADEAAELCDGCDIPCLADGHDSVLGVTVLVVDSRDSVGLEARVAASVEALPIFVVDLSMAADMRR